MTTKPCRIAEDKKGRQINLTPYFTYCSKSSTRRLDKINHRFKEATDIRRTLRSQQASVRTIAIRFNQSVPCKQERTWSPAL